MDRRPTWLVIVAGCNSMFGTFELEEQGDATAGGSSAPCAPPSTCETAPSGWEGPVALATSEAECDAWSEAKPFFEGDIQVEPVTCMPCACDAAAGASCEVVIERFDSVDCNGAPNYSDIIIPPSVCTPVNLQGASAVRAEAVAVPGQCQARGGLATPPEVTLPPPVFVCTSVAAGSCESGVCVPPAAHRCVMAPGELDCPQGYPSRHRLYESVSDERDCGCACSAPEGAACGGTLTTNSRTNCDGIDFSADFGVCGYVPQVFGAEYDPVIVSQGSCQATGGTPTGAIDLLGIRTVCCDA